MKALAPELPHKAKLGGVRLDLRTAAEVESAAAAVLTAATRAGAASPKVLVQQMVSGHEVLVGAVIDEAFGACITMRPGCSPGRRRRVRRLPPHTEAGVGLRCVIGPRCGLGERRHDLAATAKAGGVFSHEQPTTCAPG